MAEPGLNQRLRQRSRRAGFMIGVSMALTIALCIGTFSFIYAALDDTFGDFISRDVPTAVIPTPGPTQSDVALAETDPEPTEESSEPESTEAPAPTQQPTESDSTPESTEFEPDYQTSSEYSLNFRSEPSSSGGQSTVITGLGPSTPLMFMDERRESDDPGTDGEDGWMLFQLEDGTEGWLRAIDVGPYEP